MSTHEVTVTVTLPGQEDLPERKVLGEKFFTPVTPHVLILEFREALALFAKRWCADYGVAPENVRVRSETTQE